MLKHMHACSSCFIDVQVQIVQVDGQQIVRRIRCTALACARMPHIQVECGIVNVASSADDAVSMGQI